MKKRELPKRYTYRIILINHGKEVKELYKAADERCAYGEFKNLAQKSNDVVLPVRFNNNKTEIIESDYEIAIIKVRKKGESKSVQLRDNTGKYVKYTTSNNDWVILDRMPYQIEETFFVYGHHPRYDRKECGWIFNEYFLKGAKNGNLRMTALYQNKLLIEDGEDFNMVICKNKNDGIRLYNKMEELCSESKVKNMMFMGDLARSKYKSEWMDKIMETTGWSRHKIKRNSTRP